MRFCLVSILLVFFNSVSAQDRVLDSLYAVLKDHPQEDTLRVNTLTTICYKEYTYRPEKNKAAAEEALKISKAIGFSKGEGYANRYLSLYYWAVGDYGEATKYAYTMLSVFERAAQTRGVGQSYQLLGMLHEEEAELIESTDFQKAKDFYSKAVDIYKKLNAKRDLGYGYNSLGSLYIKFSQYDQAGEYFLKSLEVRKEINDQDGLSQSYSNLASVYMRQNNYTEALASFELSIAITQKLNNKYRLAISYMNMGKLFGRMKKYGNAEESLAKALAFAKSIDQKKVIEYIYSEYVELEKERNNYKGALKYTELAGIYRDSVHTQEKTKQITEMETRYETEKKEQQIQILKRDKQLHVLRLNILIAALVLITIISIVVYFLQRHETKKNRLILNLEIDNLTTQNKELSEKYKSILTAGNNNSTESVDQKLLKKAIEVVEQNISDPLFGVDKMARELGMSRTNMHRKIKAITGFPPSELIRSIRLRKAAVLLINQSDSISQISLAVGYDDHSYFSKAFKKQFGVTPSEYSQTALQE